MVLTAMRAPAPDKENRSRLNNRSSGIIKARRITQPNQRALRGTLRCREKKDIKPCDPALAGRSLSLQENSGTPPQSVTFSLLAQDSQRIVARASRVWDNHRFMQFVQSDI